MESDKFVGCSHLGIQLLLQRSLDFSTELECFDFNLSLENYFSFQGGPQFWPVDFITLWFLARAVHL